jgi:hypothetical protein
VEAEKLDLNRKGNEAAVASEHIVWCGVVCGAVCGELPQCVCGELLWRMVCWVNCSVQ